MNKTNLSTIDVKNIIEQAFNGNLAAYKAGATTEYKNDNSENIILKDEGTDEATTVDLAQYLDIHFYSWKHRVAEYDDWIASLNNVGVSTFALIELTDSEVLPSPDIDSATLTGQMTVLVPTDKVANFDFYVSKIRNIYAGNPFDITNRFGDKVKAYLNMGIALYEQEPTMEQIGECEVVRVNFSLQYLTNALSYSDIKFELSLDGTNFYELAYTKLEWINTVADTSVPRFARPDLTGALPKTISQVKALSFFDFDKTLTAEINKLFWRLGATKKNGVATTVGNVRIPITIRVTVEETNDDTTANAVYEYSDTVSEISKIVQNGVFTETHLALKSDAEVV